jgi:hypothetical protein
MDKVLQKLKKVLKEEFPSATLDLKRDWDRSRIGGFIIWRGFNGKEFGERHERVWKVIRQHMSNEEQEELATFWTLNPIEQKVRLESLELDRKLG